MRFGTSLLHIPFAHLGITSCYALSGVSLSHVIRRVPRRSAERPIWNGLRGAPPRARSSRTPVPRTSQRTEERSAIPGACLPRTSRAAPPPSLASMRERPFPDRTCRVGRCAKGTSQIAHRNSHSVLALFSYVRFGTSLLHIGWDSCAGKAGLWGRGRRACDTCRRPLARRQARGMKERPGRAAARHGGHRRAVAGGARRGIRGESAGASRLIHLMKRGRDTPDRTQHEVMPRCAKGTFQIAHRMSLSAQSLFCYVQFGTSLLHIRQPHGCDLGRPFCTSLPHMPREGRPGRGPPRGGIRSPGRSCRRGRRGAGGAQGASSPGCRSPRAGRSARCRKGRAPQGPGLAPPVS